MSGSCKHQKRCGLLLLRLLYIFLNKIYKKKKKKKIPTVGPFRCADTHMHLLFIEPYQEDGGGGVVKNRISIMVVGSSEVISYLCLKYVT